MGKGGLQDAILAHMAAGAYKSSRRIDNPPQIANLPHIGYR